MHLSTAVSIRPDGTQDHEIRIKDIPPEAIDFTGWEIQEESYIKEEELVDEREDNDQLVLEGDEDNYVAGLWLLTTKELKALLREAKLAVSGTKKQLIERLELLFLSNQLKREVAVLP